jgi:CDP-glycerol glycerophosphotransferase (TagB/SpsB family)
VFFPYDENNYIGGERELLLDYKEATPGVKVYNQKELQNELFNHLVKQEDKYCNDRNKLRETFFNYKDGKSCERLWFYVKEHYLNK